jgi:hypothetical protein
MVQTVKSGNRYVERRNVEEFFLVLVVVCEVIYHPR